MLRVRIDWDCNECGDLGCCDLSRLVSSRVLSEITLLNHPPGWSMDLQKGLSPKYYCPECTKVRQSATKEPTNAPEDQTRTHPSHVC